MKIQFRSAMFSLIVVIICVITSLLLVTMKVLFIEKWFDLLISISLGLFANSILIFTISLVSFFYIRKENARKIAIELNLLQTECSVLKVLLLYYQNDEGEINIPKEPNDVVGNTLARLDELSMRISSSDRISPLAATFIEKHKKVCSTFIISEYSFFKAFSRLLLNCHIAYNTYRLSPYIKAGAEIDTIQTNLRESLQNILKDSDSKSEFHGELKGYQQTISKILKITELEKEKNETETK